MLANMSCFVSLYPYTLEFKCDKKRIASVALAHASINTYPSSPFTFHQLALIYKTPQQFAIANDHLLLLLLLRGWPLVDNGLVSCVRASIFIEDTEQPASRSIKLKFLPLIHKHV